MRKYLLLRVIIIGLFFILPGTAYTDYWEFTPDFSEHYSGTYFTNYDEVPLYNATNYTIESDLSWTSSAGNVWALALGDSYNYYGTSTTKWFKMEDPSDQPTYEPYFIWDSTYQRIWSFDGEIKIVNNDTGCYFYIDDSYVGSAAKISSPVYVGYGILPGYTGGTFDFGTLRIWADSDYPNWTPIPTPTIAQDLCGYWAFSVNSSNIVRNGWVQGTATESDPDNKHKKIDWYLVLPSGQEFIQKSFVYDDGFFGLGAGWIEVNPYSGYASASSEAAAKQNDIQYTTAGNNHHMRIKVYEDKSLIPAAYHDYHLFCTLDQVVHVSETTQGMGNFGVNVWESGTNTLIYGATVHLYDYQTGEWYNKSSSTGGTIYFSVVPGHNHRILVDEPSWNTYDENYFMPDPVPSQPYSIYLVRPSVDVPGASYARFYVKDGSTYQALYLAAITLSDGQTKSTLPSGFAEFNVTDSTSYYYTVSKTGYNGATGTFNISSDTVLPTVYLYPRPVETTPTTIPYWTQTPTPLPTYENGTVIPGNTYAPTVTATLNVVERGAKLTESTDIWYRYAPMLSNLLFLCVIIGILGLMTKAIGGGKGGGGRRRR